MSNSVYFQNNQYSRVMNSKYKSKYKKLKRAIKEYVFENAALCDQIAETQEQLINAKEERCILLQRLVQHESDVDTQLLNNEIGTVAPDGTLTPKTVTPGKRGPKKRSNSDIGVRKPKTISKKSTSQIVSQIAVDPQGKPVFPVSFGSFVLQAIGEILHDSPNFHTENWIYPVGYVATRIYAHPKDPQRKCVFTCKILNNSGVPQFQIIPDSEFDHVYFGESANVCHLGLLDDLVRSAQVHNLPLRAQGERFFGLGHPAVIGLLEQNPNLEKCANFKGFLKDAGYPAVEDHDPTLSYEALRNLTTMSTYHMEEIKEEPPDDLLE